MSTTTHDTDDDDIVDEPNVCPDCGRVGTLVDKETMVNGEPLPFSIECTECDYVYVY